jgi:hypothetical protein
VRKFTGAIYAKHTRLNGCAARNALLGLLINHEIILAPFLPQVPRASIGIEHCWNDDDDDDNNNNNKKKKNQSTQRKSCSSAVLTTIYVIWIGLGSNLSLPVIYGLLTEKCSISQ